MSVVLPQPGARWCAVLALVVVGGGLLLAIAMIRGMFAVAGAHSLMTDPNSLEVHREPRPSAPARPPK